MKNFIKFPKTLLIVLLLPLVIASVGVWALKDRADALDNVPAAVVNLDEGTEMEIDGETQTVPFGRMLAGALTQPTTVKDAQSDATAGFDWQLTTKKDAEQGLKDGTYSAVVVIPKDFSDHLGSMGTQDATQATVIINTNDASGMLDSFVGQSIAEVVANEFNGQMAQQYLDGLYLGFNSLQDGFQESADGATELSDGAKKLSTGTHELNDGAGQLATGVDELNGGASQLADGASQLSDGTNALAEGSGALADGSSELAGGADQLSSGLDQLADGANQVATGVEQLNTGINGTKGSPGLKQGATQLAQGVNGDGTAANPGLVAGSRQLADGLSQYSSGLRQAQDGLTTGLQQGVDTVFTQGSADTPSFVQSVDSLATACTEVKALFDGDPRQAALNELCGGLDQLNSSGVPAVQSALTQQLVPKAVDSVFEGDSSGTNPGLIPSADTLAKGAQTSADAVPELVDGINQLNDGITQLGDGSAQLAPGARQVAEGLNTSATGSASLASGAKQLADGAGELDTGVQQLNDGASGLADGTGTLSTGVDELATGAHKLADGSSELAGGSDELSDGTQQLADGLQDGADSVPTYSENERSHLAKVSTNSVTLDSVRDNEVDGGSVATFPFVAGLGLWLGAFGIFLIWPALRKRYLDSAIPMWRVVLHSLVPAVLAGVIQALLVVALIVIFGVPVASLASTTAIALVASISFVTVHQMLLAVCGNRIGRIVSIAVLVLQVVALVGIMPLESAPPLLQSLTSFMPLTVASQGLMYAALGGALASTSSTVGVLLLFSALSIFLTLVAARSARAFTPTRTPMRLAEVA